MRVVGPLGALVGLRARLAEASVVRTRTGAAGRSSSRLIVRRSPPFGRYSRRPHPFVVDGAAAFGSVRFVDGRMRNAGRFYSG
jgi:hypothetical protein